LFWPCLFCGPGEGTAQGPYWPLFWRKVKNKVKRGSGEVVARANGLWFGAGAQVSVADPGAQDPPQARTCSP